MWTSLLSTAYGMLERWSVEKTTGQHLDASEESFSEKIMDAFPFSSTPGLQYSNTPDKSFRQSHSY
jgi:hypothetical protein